MRLRGNMRGDVTKALEAAAINLERFVKRAYGSGSPLRTRTGTLKRSPTHSPVKTDSRGPYIEVGSPLVYAPVHELGLWAGRGRGFRMKARPVWGPIFIRMRKKIAFGIKRQLRRNFRGSN